MSTEQPFVPVAQPFRGGERVVVVANAHDDRASLDLTGRWGTICGVYPYPIDRVMPVDGACRGCGPLPHAARQPRTSRHS